MDLDMHARLMEEWMQSSTSRFWIKTSKPVFSILTSLPTTLSFSRIMTPSTSPKWQKLGSMTMGMRYFYGQHSLQTSTLSSIYGII